ncbi:MAG TPA: hypothetical protein VM580_16325 [Labilithrix sp.]|nr:hypothetical protein [Labilithrix sp.]
MADAQDVGRDAHDVSQRVARSGGAGEERSTMLSASSDGPI